MVVSRKKLKKSKSANALNKKRDGQRTKLPSGLKLGTFQDLMKHSGTWVGDDIDYLLQEVIASRSLSQL